MGLLYRRSMLTMQKQLFSTVISPKIFFPKTKGFFICLIFPIWVSSVVQKIIFPDGKDLPPYLEESIQGWVLGYVAGP